MRRQVLTPRFSPTQQQITYMALFDNRPGQVFLFNIETGEQEQLGTFRGMTFAPRFSPDGRQVIMTDTTKNRHGVQFFGSDGWVATRGDWIEAKPQSLLKIKLRPNELSLYDSQNHEANFLACVKTRTQTITPIEVAHRSTSVCLLGGMALRLNRELQWNPDEERFVKDEQANRLLTYAMRSPWTL